MSLEQQKGSEDVDVNMTKESPFADEMGTHAQGSDGPSRKRRTRTIIIVGVIAAVLMIVVVVVVVAVGANNGGEKQAEESNKDEDKSGCGPFNVTYAESAPSFIVSSSSSFYLTGCKIRGDCWKGEECFNCFDGPNKDRVGNLNHIPVCCPQCARSGLILSWSSCNCSTTNKAP